MPKNKIRVWSYFGKTLLIPDYDPYDPKPYPGDIKPGYYRGKAIGKLLKQHADNPDAMQFLKDMLE